MTFGSGHDGQLASSPFVAQLVACKNSLRISDAITNQPPPPTTIQGGAASEGRGRGSTRCAAHCCSFSLLAAAAHRSPKDSALERAL